MISQTPSRQGSPSKPYKDDSSLDVGQWFPRNVLYPTLQFLIVDTFLLSVMAPLVGCWHAGHVASFFNFGIPMELVLTVIFTSLTVKAVLMLVGEDVFWKRLFHKDTTCFNTLFFRDFVNLALIAVYIYGLTYSLEKTLKDKSLKESYLNEGVPYLVWKNFLGWFPLNVEKTLEGKHLHLPHKGSFLDPNLFGENERFEHGARIVLYVALLTSAVSKGVYYNTLWTFLKALKIFTELKPEFEKEGIPGECGSSSGNVSGLN